jgi:hypothetical protein
MPLLHESLSDFLNSIPYFTTVERFNKKIIEIFALQISMIHIKNIIYSWLTKSAN